MNQSELEFFCGYCTTHKPITVKISRMGKKPICFSCDGRREKNKTKGQQAKDYKYARAKRQYQNGTMPIPS